MLQSFRVDASTPPPSLWRVRFGAESAKTLWTRLDGAIWWQAWPREGDPVLIVPRPTAQGDERDLPESTKPLARELDNLLLVFSDRLNKSSFDDQFQPVVQGSANPLERYCLQILRSQTSIAWTPASLQTIAGPLQPFLQRASHGCLAIELDGTQLRWSGVVAARSLKSASQRLSPPSNPIPLPRSSNATVPTASRSLLSVTSRSARALFGAVLQRSVIQKDLVSDYGVSLDLQHALLDAPLSLRVEPSPDGPFQANLQLDLHWESRQAAIDQALNIVRERLAQTGLTAAETALPLSEEFSEATATHVVDQSEAMNRVIGGWTWILAAKPQQQPAVLRLSLAESPDSASPQLSFPHSSIALMLSMRPSDLREIGLLSPGWPGLISSSIQLDLLIQPLEGVARSNDDWSWMSGQLVLP